jgi:hypothetical protein
MPHVLTKRPLNFNGLRSVISQKIELFRTHSLVWGLKIFFRKNKTKSLTLWTLEVNSTLGFRSCVNKYARKVGSPNVAVTFKLTWVTRFYASTQSQIRIFWHHGTITICTWLSEDVCDLLRSVLLDWLLSVSDSSNSSHLLSALTPINCSCSLRRLRVSGDHTSGSGSSSGVMAAPPSWPLIHCARCNALPLLAPDLPSWRHLCSISSSRCLCEFPSDLQSGIGVCKCKEMKQDLTERYSAKVRNAVFTHRASWALQGVRESRS